MGGYQLAIGWLCPKINTLQDIVIYYNVPKLHMAAINTSDCSEFTRCFYYWMAIGWLYVPKSIHLNTQSYTTMYQSDTWLLSIILTTVCSQHCLGISWQSAGYWLAMSQTQYISRHSHILLCMKVVHGCKQYFGLQCVHKLSGHVAWMDPLPD